jgi:hypothetical protein
MGPRRDLAMPTLPAKSKQQSPFEVRDLGLAAAIAASGFPFRLESQNGTFRFIFTADHEKLAKLQSDYFSGELRLPARDVISHQKILKDAIFAARRMT